VGGNSREPQTALPCNYFHLGKYSVQGNNIHSVGSPNFVLFLPSALEWPNLLECRSQTESSNSVVLCLVLRGRRSKLLRRRHASSGGHGLNGGHPCAVSRRQEVLPEGGVESEETSAEGRPIRRVGIEGPRGMRSLERRDTGCR